MISFIHINKCGGKSIDEALVKLLGRDKYREIHGLVGTPVTKGTRGELILFVRDPIERAISSYHYFRMRKRDYSSDFNDIISHMRKDPSYAKKELARNTHLAYSLSWYIRPEVIKELKFYFVGKLETIESDWKVLLEKLEVSQEPLVRKNMTIRLGKELSLENLEYLKNLYKDDYECMKILADRGYLPGEYIEEINNKEKYMY